MGEIFFFVFFLPNADTLQTYVNRFHQERFQFAAVLAKETDEYESDRDGGDQNRPFVDPEKSDQCSSGGLLFMSVTIHRKVFPSYVNVAMLHIIVKREKTVNRCENRFVAFAMFRIGGISMMSTEQNHQGGSFDETKF